MLSATRLVVVGSQLRDIDKTISYTKKGIDDGEIFYLVFMIGFTFTYYLQNKKVKQLKARIN